METRGHFYKRTDSQTIIAMCASEAFIGKTDVNPFHFSKNDLAEVTIYTH